MYATDLSAVLPPHERQIYDTLTAKAIQLLRDRQHSDLTTARAKVKPKGDRMRVAAGD